MFWSTNHENSISDILNNEDVKLTDVLDHETLLQECRIQSEDLITYFKSKAIINQLVTYVLQCPSNELKEEIRFKYSSLACEVLISDMPEIHDILIKGIELNENESETCFVERFFNTITNNEEINPLIMSFSLRVILALLKYNNDEVLRQISVIKDSLSILIKLIHLNGVSTFFEEFILSTKEDDELRIKWLRDGKFVYNLSKMMGENNITNLAVENVLINIIKSVNDDSLNKNVKANIIEMFEEDTFLDSLFKSHISNQESSSHLVSSILTIISTITEVTREDGSNPFVNNVKYIVDNFDAIRYLMKNPPKDTKETIRCTIGEIKSVGRVRIEILRLVKNIIKLNDKQWLNKIHDCNILYIIIMQVSDFKWNSLYHLNVLGIFNEIFRDLSVGANTKFLQSSLVHDFKLFEWYNKQATDILQSNVLIGYSGIIWQIGCLLEKFIESELGKEILDDDDSISKLWCKVKDDYLIPRNKKNEVTEVALGSTYAIDFKLADLNADEDDDESGMVTNPDLLAKQFKGDNTNDIFADLSRFRASSPKATNHFLDLNNSDPQGMGNQDSFSSDDWVENILQIPNVPIDESDDVSSSDSESDDEKPPAVIQQNKQGSAKYIQSGVSSDSFDFGLCDAPVDSPIKEKEKHSLFNDFNDASNDWPENNAADNANSNSLPVSDSDNWANF